MYQHIQPIGMAGRRVEISAPSSQIFNTLHIVCVHIACIRFTHMSNQIVRSLTVISEVVAYLGLPSFDIHSLLIVYVVIYLMI